MMDTPIRVLVVEDNPADLKLMRRQFAQGGLAAEWRCVSRLGDLQEALAEGGWDVVLSDYNVPQMEFGDVLASVLAHCEDLPLLLVSGSVGEERAVELLRLGVWDFVLKDRLVRLVPAVEHGLREAAERRARREIETALRESETRFRALVEQLPAITYVGPLDREEADTYVSPQVLDILGFSPAECVSTPGFRLRQIHPEDRERVIGCLREWQTAGGAFVCEYRMLCRNGQTVWIRDEAEPIGEGTGEPVLCRGLMLDISGHKRAELERETTVAFLRLVNGSTSIRDLVQQATTFFQKASGCDAVGVRLEQGGDYPYYEAHGFPEEFLLLENSLCERDGAGRVCCGTDGYPLLECMCGNVIRGRFDPTKSFFTERGSFWTNCTAELLATSSEKDRQARTRNRCNGEGYESVALLPLRAGEERLGLLQLNHRGKGCFSAECIALWERLADYLAVAVGKLRAEEALLESEERHRLLFETSRDAMVTASPPAWHFTHGNPAAIRMFGARDEEDLTSRAPWDYSPEKQPDGLASVDKARQMIETAVSSGSHVFEWRHRRLDGEEFPALVLLTRFEVHGQTMVQATVRDVTAQKEAEAALQASEERYRALFEGVPEGIIVPDVDTRRLRFANPALCRMLGYSLDELLQMRVEDIHPSDALVAVMSDFGEHARGTVESSEGIPCLCKDGSVIHVDITSSRIEFDGKPCLVAFFEDVTDRLRLAADKEKLEAQVRQTQKLEAIGSLAGGVAHDFNNILTGIRGYVEFAMDELAERVGPTEDLQQAMGLVDRAADLTRQLLAFSRKQTLMPVVLELNQLIREHLRMLERLLGEDILVRFLPAPDLGTVEADRGQISQVLMNLVVNARDAMPNGGTLTIETANASPEGEGMVPSRPHARITVRDTGTGMDSATMARIFEPFFTTKEQGRGTGMGLATVHGIVKQHGGDIQVSSEAGQGTTFTVYLPCVPAESGEAPVPAAAPEGGTETILLVEDEGSVRLVLQKWLARWGYQVVSAADASEAMGVAAAQTGAIDLLLTDVVMPGRNGLELYEALRATRPGLEVLYMSGYTNEAIMDRGISWDRDHFIEKPISSDVLAAKLREMLGPAPKRG